MSNTTIEVEVESLRLEFEVTLGDADLKKHLDSGRARMILRWKCSETFRLGQKEPQKISTLARSSKYAVNLPQEELDGRLELELQILAAEEMPGYRLVSQNLDYGDASFDIKIGDVLAVGGYTTIHVGKNYDPMRPPLQACFVFEKDETVGSGIELNFTGDQVIVGIAPDLYDNFGALRGREDFQIAAVMLPALMGALDYMQHGQASGDVLEDLGWYRSLSGLLDQRRLREKPVLEQAQAILEDPIGRTFATQITTLGAPQEDLDGQ